MSMPEDIRIFRVTPTVISFLDYTAVSRRKRRCPRSRIKEVQSHLSPDLTDKMTCENAGKFSGLIN